MRHLAREAADVTTARQAALHATLDELAATTELFASRDLELTVEIAAVELARAGLEVALDAADQEVPAATDAVVAARRRARIVGLDIPVVAVDAYLGAEDLLAEVWPECNVRWWMIAGVARIESRHGTLGGRTLGIDGRPSREILGIPLDGRPGVREILDTDDGRLDGDVVHDRAVGPLQFIPETWTRRGRDADGDGRADPHDLDDAAYSTGRYLCALGGDLSDTASLRSAYFGYNTSSAYVDAVHDHARSYAEFTFAAVEERVDNDVENGSGTGD